MTNMQLRILKCLAKCPQGKTLNELEQISQACDPIDFAITLDAMVENNWIYKKNQDDKYFRITGIGEAALRAERTIWNTYSLSIASIVLAAASFLLALTSFLAHGL